MVEHLFYSHFLLSCILAKLFNMMMYIGYVPLRFGESYTVRGCMVRVGTRQSRRGLITLPWIRTNHRSVGVVM